MSAALQIGRVGGLAVALGVGVAIVTGCAAIASADAGSPESSATSVRSSPSRNPVHTGPAQRTKRPTIPTRQPSAAATAAPARQVRAVSTRTAPRAVAQMTPTVNPNALPPTPALKEIWVGVASSVMGLAESALRAVGIATYLGPTTSTLNQTLVVNGYNLVPSSTETVTSFYGQWTFWPGGPTLVQGQQQYSVVDPATNQPVGTFDALVSTGSPFNIRSKYV